METYEKKYKEALENFKLFREAYKTTDNSITYKEMRELFANVENSFPELIESDDERLRKELLNAFKEATDSLYMVLTPSKREAFIAWLEKQGEHANFRNKIQIGDKVTRNEDGVLVNLSQLKRVAKPVEPMIVGQEPLYDYTNANICQKDFAEQKPAWSEEDEKTINNICHIIRQYDKISKRENQPCWYVGDCLLWMQNIKDRVLPQPKQEWSEEDEEMLNLIIARLHSHSNVDLEEYSKEYDWLKNKLKSLRPKSTWKPSEEQLNALHWCVMNVGSTEHQVLQELLEQLEKLKD